MTSEIVVAVVSGAGTLLGSLLGLLASARLTNYRIGKLEEKVDKHNDFATRIPVLEKSIQNVESKVNKLEDRVVNK